MLRECVRHEPLAKIILHSEDFYRFFSYVEVSTFDIASDAFATFKDLLTKHKILCAQFLENNYDKVRKISRDIYDSDDVIYFLVVGIRALSETAQFRELCHKTAVAKGMHAYNM